MFKHCKNYAVSHAGLNNVGVGIEDLSEPLEKLSVIMNAALTIIYVAVSLSPCST